MGLAGRVFRREGSAEGRVVWSCEVQSGLRKWKCWKATESSLLQPAPQPTTPTGQTHHSITRGSVRARSCELPAQPACSQRVQRVAAGTTVHIAHTREARCALLFTRDEILAMHLIIIVLVRANHGPRHSDRTNTCRIVLDDFHRGWARLVADDALSHHVDGPS